MGYHGQRMTCPAKVRPPPKPKSRTGDQEGISRRSTSLDRASGTLAAEVLPDSMMSLATTAFVTPSLRASGSMIRRLAWCGTNAARSRSEERRVGEEGRSRWAPYHLKKKKRE